MAVSGQGSIPATLGRYRVLRRLGAGGMAEVFLARSSGAEGIQKTLVVKRILPSIAKRPRFISMFVDEAKLTTRLNHPNIVQVYGFEQVRGEFLLAMEYVDGPDLSRLVARGLSQGIRLSPQLAAFIVAEAAKGLDYAHRRVDERNQPMEIVHRDVSPQNILISHGGGVKITDFGIARARSFSERGGVIQGKFAYMSPEQANGAAVDRRCDVYGLGAVLTELLAGRPLFERGARVLEAVRRGEVPGPTDLDPDVPLELDAVARRAMAPDPEDRFSSVRDMLRALTGYLHGQHEPVDQTAFENWIDGVLPPEQRGGERPSAVGLPGVPLPRGGSSLTSEAALVDHVRERRPVLVVAGQLRRPRAPLDVTSVGVVERILDDIAYKAQAVLGWSEDLQVLERRNFRLVLGLGESRMSEPLRAVRLALDVLDALASLGEGSESLVCGGIGMSRGIASITRDVNGRLIRYQPEDDAFELADALARDGRMGEVLVAGEVYRLARREFAFGVLDVREVALAKGEDLTPQAVRAYPLIGARGYDDRVAQGRTGARGMALVGRAEVIARLERSVAEAIRDGVPRALRIVGPLGVGKTACVLAALERVGTMARCLHLECGFGSARDPLSTARQLLHLACGYGPGHIAAATEDACLALLGPGELARTHASRAARLLEGPDSSDDTPLSHTADTIAAVLSALAKERPLLVCVDALQWVDEASLQVLVSLVKGGSAGPVVFWLSGRPEPRLEELLDDIPSYFLGELARQDSLSLLSTCFDEAEVPKDIAALVLSRAGGNPLFIVEIAEALRERGAVSVERGPTGLSAVRHFGGPFQLPAALEDVVSTRLLQLDAESLRVLRWLAVLGARVDEKQLSEVMELSVETATADLEARGLLRRDARQRLVFANGVVQQVALDGLDLRDRARMQRRVDAALFATRPYLRLVVRARDLEHQGLGAQAATAFAAAAKQARRAGELHDALRYWARSLSLVPAHDEIRVDLHRRRIETLRVLGDSSPLEAEIQRLRQFAESTGAARARGWAFAWLGYLAATRGDPLLAQTRLEVCRATEAAARDVSLSFFVVAVEARMLLLQGETHAAQDLLGRALQVAHEPVEPEVLAPLQLGLARLAARDSDWPRAQRAALESMAAAVAAGDRRSEAAAAEQLALSSAAHGNFEDALWLLRGAQARARDAGIPAHSARRLLRLGRVCVDAGDERGARQHLTRASEVATRLDAPGVCAQAILELLLFELYDAVDVARAHHALGRLAALADVPPRILTSARGHLAAQEENWVLAESALAPALKGAPAAERPVILAQLAMARSAAGDLEGARRQAIAAFELVCAYTAPNGWERAHVMVQRALSHARLAELAGRCRVRGRDRVTQCTRQFRDPQLLRVYTQSRHVRMLREVRG